MRSSKDSNSAQGLEVITIEVFTVIGGWLMKDQSEYNELYSVTMDIRLSKLQYYSFGVQSLESPNNYLPIKLSYIKSRPWLKLIGYSNSLYIRATRAITNHMPIGEY